VHAIVTDPPYGLKEHTEPEKEKLRRGRGGVWRIPPSFDGCTRSPLPRFTVLDKTYYQNLRSFFLKFAYESVRVLVSGAHVFIATPAARGQALASWITAVSAFCAIRRGSRKPGK
jgi:tRNA G10  N-methylase Trm11